MANPIFGADSRLDQDTLTSDVASDADFPLANLHDDRIFTVWKPASAATSMAIKTDSGVGNTVEVNYLMVVGHDLFDPAQDGLGPVLLNFQRSSDGSSFANFIPSILAFPTDNRIIARSFSKVIDRAFRILLTRAGAFIPSLGEVKWGKRVELPTGAQVGFDPNQERINARFSRSQTGNILGAVNSYIERRAVIDLPLLESSFIDGTSVGDFGEFWDNHASLTKPFLFHWNPGNPGSFETDAFFGVVDPDAGISRPLTTPLISGFRTLTMEVVGLKE